MNLDKTINIEGFDENGEPEIRIYDDNHIELVFASLPPLNGDFKNKDSSYWNTFENVISKYLGITVLRVKNEIFIINHPNANTVKKLKEYLENYWFITDFFQRNK